MLRSAFALLLWCAALTPVSARDSCAVREPTEADAMKWMGMHLSEVTPQASPYIKAAIAAEEMRAQANLLGTLYPVAGKDGKSALDSLRTQGFTCGFELLQGVRTSKQGAALEPAALPVYRCSKVDAGSCLCRRKQVVFGAGPQAPGRPAEEYRQRTEAMTLDAKDVDHTCRSADE
jgi:hypothetical protein